MVVCFVYICDLYIYDSGKLNTNAGHTFLCLSLHSIIVKSTRLLMLAHSV